MKYVRLEKMRKCKGISVQSIAQYLCIHPQIYQRYERGQGRLPLNIIRMLAVFYTVSADYLLGLTDETAPYPKPQHSIQNSP